MQDTTAAPGALVRQLIMGFRSTSLLHVAAELGLADRLAGGPRSAAELASELGAHADALGRVLRGLVAFGVFARRADGRYALTDLGACLRDDAPGSLRAVARIFGHAYIQHPWGELLHTVMTGQTAFDHVFGMDSFAYLTAHPEMVATFNRALTTATPAIVAAYDFSGPGLVVDVGGGSGGLLAGLLAANPATRGIVFDLPHSADAAAQTLAAAGVADRGRFEAGDFFAAVPPGADAYLLKLILHDWDDDRCGAILRACRRAVAPQGRVLIIERRLPDDDESGFEAVLADINMLAATGGRERGEAAYRALLARADFALARAIPTASPFHIFEGTPI